MTLTHEEYERLGMPEVMKMMKQVWKESVTLLRADGKPGMQIAYIPPAEACACAPSDCDWWCGCCDGFAPAKPQSVPPGILTELWHVQMTRNGDPFGWYQFFHPNEAAAQEEAARLRVDLPWAEAHVCRFVLADVAPAPRTVDSTKEGV